MSLLDVVALAALEGALLIAIVWGIGRLFPRMPASLRCGLWWVACLKLLVGLAALQPIALPLLPAKVSAPAAVVQAGAGVEIAKPVGSAGGAAAPRAGRSYLASMRTAARSAVTPAASWMPRWTHLLAAAWAAGVGAGLAGWLGDLRRARALRRRAKADVPPRLVALLDESARIAGLPAPALAVSPDAQTPQTMGLLSPLIVIPEGDAARLTDAEMRMVLLHELEHVRRRDLWLGWIPAAARLFFFFHPLAHLAAREYALAREAACDAAVLSREGAADYGRLLVRLGTTRRAAGCHAVGAAGGLTTLKRRLQMLEHAKEISWTRWALALGAVAVVGLVPFRVVARPAPIAALMPAQAEFDSAGGSTNPKKVEEKNQVVPAHPIPAHTIPEQRIPPKKVVVPETRVRAHTVVTPEGETIEIPEIVVPKTVVDVPEIVIPRIEVPEVTVPEVRVPPQRPVLSRNATLPAPPVGPRPPRPLDRQENPLAPAEARDEDDLVRTGRDDDEDEEDEDADEEDDGDDDDESPFVLFHGKGDGTVVSGSTRDVNAAHALRGAKKEPMLWFRHGGKAYVVRDPKVIAPIASLFEGDRTLDAREEELEAKQEALEEPMEELSEKLNDLGRQMRKLSRAQRKANDEELGEKLGEQMESLSDEMEEHGREMEKLGREMEKLGREQEKLGRQHEKHAEEAEEKIQDDMDDWIESGVAQPVK